MRRAELTSCLWVPITDLGGSIDKIKRELTFYKAGWMDEPDVEIPGYAISEDETMIGLPISYGLKLFQKRWPGETYENRIRGRVWHEGQWPDSDVQPRDGDQRMFFKQLEQAVGSRLTTLAEAPTGSGKTIAALMTAKAKGVRCLAIVPDDQVGSAWRKAAKNLFNLDDDQIGQVGGGVDEWEDKLLVIGVINSMATRDMPERFYSDFGMVVWDEAHRLGATTFSRTMFKFAARHQLAMTATPNRKDKCEGMFLNHFGAPAVRHRGDAIPCNVTMVKFNVGMPKMNEWQPATQNRLLSKMKKRNEIIVYFAKKLYNDGRSIIVFSHLIDHLASLRDLLKAEGIPHKQMGFLTRQVPQSDGSRKKAKAEYLERISTHSRIIFATYQYKAGIDIPRLDAGIEALPISEGVQPPGRIRRPLDGKRTPEWISIEDVGVKRLEAMTRTRLREYKKTNMHIDYHGT